MASVAASDDRPSGAAAPPSAASCRLAFHGAAANSCPHSLLWVRAPAPHRTNDTSRDHAPSGVAAGNDDGGRGGGSPRADTVIYASSGVVNLATSYVCAGDNAVVSVDSTLVTRTLDHHATEEEEGGGKKRVLARGEAAEDAAAARSITALAWIGCEGGDEDGSLGGAAGIVAAFSDGTLTSFRCSGPSRGWTEHVLVGNDPLPSSPEESGSSSATRKCNRHVEEGVDAPDLRESIADVSASSLGRSCWLVATASSRGIFLHASSVEEGQDGCDEEEVHTKRISGHASASVQLQRSGSGSGGSSGERYLFAGSASPRHNKVYVYTVAHHRAAKDGAGGEADGAWVSLPLLSIMHPVYHGHLLGHQDWIACFAWLDRFAGRGGGEDVAAAAGGRRASLLASSGHDAKIRLWKFTSREVAPSSSAATKGEDGVPELEDDDTDGGSSGDGSDDEDEADVDDLEEEEGEARLVIERNSSPAAVGAVTAVSLEALLLGHEEAVTSLTWRRTDGNSERPCLLSSSMDRTILLWMEEDDGVWTPASRVGSAGGILGGSVGASLMGFVDATFSPDGGASRIAGHGYGGSIHFWTQRNDAPSAEGDEGENNADDDALATARWVADPCITGHFRSVEDMAWDPAGEYLLTTSSDQTTRLWAEVPVSGGGGGCRFVEVGRPQVHGYDMTSIACIGGDEGVDGGDGEPRHRFASGADEKVVRVFDAPASALRSLRSIRRSRGGSGAPPAASADEEETWRVERAFMPSLGLSNKATADADQESSKFAGPTSDDGYAEALDSVVDEKESSAEQLKLPSERDLGVTTLWPEARKLFGHESELVCLDAYRAPPSSGNGSLVASSCKARNDVASAAIRLWDAKKGKCMGILKGGHRSTVSTMSFSQDGKYLASSGKDRRICVWKREVDQETGSVGYELSAAADSAHKRIVWSVHFCPLRSDILASGSRDGLVKVWRVLEEDDGSLGIKELLKFEPAASKAGKIPVTAVQFAEAIIEGIDGRSDSAILGIGTENGRIEVWSVPISPAEGSSSPKLLCAITANDCHFDTVKKIAWRPATKHADEASSTGPAHHVTFASCGQDNGVRVFELVVRES